MNHVNTELYLLYDINELQSIIKGKSSKIFSPNLFLFVNFMYPGSSGSDVGTNIEFQCSLVHALMVYGNVSIQTFA